MNEKRCSYNPFTKHFIVCNQSHSISLYNIGKQSEFDSYIRLIIVNNKLFIRVYYPFKDIDTLTLLQLKQASYSLIKTYEIEVLTQLYREGISPIEIIYNADNDLLKGLSLANL